ncbi:hypothetical protein LY76DRAFT_91784 [Colletotrichum caudatum]|nr:hypothetical protein LY76DRAFT_91784 [Colletotrichum caudatum]
MIWGCGLRFRRTAYPAVVVDRTEAKSDGERILAQPSYTTFLYGLEGRDGGREVSVCERRCKWRKTWVSPTTGRGFDFPHGQVRDDKRAMLADPFFFFFFLPFPLYPSRVA